MLWIGITGSIGSGKSTVSELLRKQGLGVLDADEIAKSTLASEGPAFRKVIQFFGTSILDREGQINRSALAKIVFSDKKKREFLESIIHPEVRFVIEESKTEYRKNNEKYLMLNQTYYNLTFFRLNTN